jgi:nicotinamidase-related amidase
MQFLKLRLKSQELRTNSYGYKQWVEIQTEKKLYPEKTAVVISDMWDLHWSTGATARAGVMAERINETISLLRNKGVLIIHCPSDTMNHYGQDEARKRLLEEKLIQPITIHNIENIPFPIDHSDGGSDTIDDYSVNQNVWSKQNEKIEINQEKDLIAGDEGDRIYSYLKNREMDTILYMGVHTNMCVLGRSFGIKRMSGWGMDCILFEDLTDAMYNPERRPYVSHDEGTKLVIKYIEKFYCPTASSWDL